MVRLACGTNKVAGFALLVVLGCGESALESDSGSADVGLDSVTDVGADTSMSDVAERSSCDEAGDPAPLIPFEPVTVPAHEESMFEGFAVRSSIPSGARGLVVIFHGTGGSAALVERVETSAFLQTMLDAGFGFLATESTEREGAARWDVAPSPTNEDMLRVTRLIDTTRSGAGRDDLPVFLVGVSNGGVFVGSFAEYLEGEGRPPHAISIFEAAWRRDVFAAGAPSAPTFHLSVENETVSDFERAREQVAEVLRDERAPLVDVLVTEVPLVAERFLRIPGFDADRSTTLFNALVELGVINVEGMRLVDAEEATARITENPPRGFTGPELQDMRDQLLVTWAMHQMRSDYSRQIAAFFDCHLQI